MNIQQLKARYAAPEIPKCRVCGGELTIQRAGGGPTIWGCTGMIDDPIGERKWIYAEGRSCADEHYESSRWSDYRQGGDADVIELIDALEAAERERDELKESEKKNVLMYASAKGRYEAAEAELARRDAAGDPVAWKWRLNSLYDSAQIGPWRVCLAPLTPGKGNGCKTEAIPLYTAAPPAVLPELEQDVKNIIGLLSEGEWAEHCTTTQLGQSLEVAITELHNMRAQPQKVVELPTQSECEDLLSAYEALEHVKAALDAANVKWEVKK